MSKEQKTLNLDWDVLADESSLSENRIPPKKGTKYDVGKPKLALIPPIAERLEGMALTYGEDKYGKHNYQQGLEALRLLSAAKRHISEWIDGNEVDEESGIHHLGHARANLGMLLQLQATGRLIDDRWSKDDS